MDGQTFYWLSTVSVKVCLGLEQRQVNIEADKDFFRAMSKMENIRIIPDTSTKHLLMINKSFNNKMFFFK